jgi:PAS domain S-box-containing protein
VILNARIHGHRDVWVFDAAGKLALQALESPPDTAAASAALQAIKTARVSFRHTAKGKQDFAYFASPVVATDSSKAIGAVVVAVDAAAQLFPIATRYWQSQSTEQAYIREWRGDSAIAITPLRNGRLMPARSITATQYPGVAALRGIEKFESYSDIVSGEVFAAGREIRNAPWSVVVIANKSAALHEVYAWDRQVLYASLGLLLAIIGIAYALSARKRAQRAVAFAREARERARINEELQAAHTRFHTLFDSATVGIAIVGGDGIIMEANQHFAKILGYQPGQLRGASLNSITPTADHEAQRAWLHSMMTTASDFFSREKRYLRQDGTVIAARVAGSIIRKPDGGIDYFVGMVEDITARRQVEEALKVTQERVADFEARAAALLQTDVVGIAIGSPDGRVFEANDYYLNLIGYSRCELLAGAISWIELTPPEHLERDLRALEELKTRGSSTPYEKEYIHKSGKRISVLMGDATLPNERVLTFVVDVTAQKQLEQQYLQAQKMEAVGQLAGGVAHDFNNILTAIKGLACMALEECNKSDPLHADLEEISNCADRATALTRQLLAFSRRQVLQPRAFDDGELVESLSRMLQRLIGEDIELVVLRDPPPLTVHADPAQIEQVVLNLAVNARDAMPAGG